MQHLKNRRWLSGVLMMLLLASCSNLPTPLVTQTQLIEVPRVVYPRPVGVESIDVAIVVATPQRMAQWLSDIETGTKKPEAYFGYNEADYLTVAQWLQELLRYINAQNAVIETYETEANQHNERLAKPPDDTS